jgi:isopropylmalate/homocitrate/citramalate synthase
MSLVRAVRIVEVGPRDGLQNEPCTVPTATKLALIRGLAEAGLGTVEIGSFVSPKLVPQMADTAAVLASLDLSGAVRYPVLVPNLQGLEAALAAGARDLALFTAASDAFSERNTNCSVAESLSRLALVAEKALAAGARLRGYVSCVLGCPYQGAVPVRDVVAVAATLADLGCYEISLGDTIGVGTPGQARAMLETVALKLGMERLAVHFHDTYGQALANILACLESGVGVIDSSVAGLGGCPYAKGATGNVATEDVVYMLNGLGIATGIDLDRLASVGRFIAGALGRASASRVGQALAAKAS